MVITLITIEIVERVEQEKNGESVGILKSKAQHIYPNRLDQPTS